MLTYRYVSEELNKGILRVLNTMLLAYILPLWMQLLYMGEAAGESAAARILIWNESLHPTTVRLLTENLTMIVYVIVLEIVQRHVRNFWIYCGSHVVCMMLMWMTLQDSAGRIPRLIVCVLLLVCAFYARIHETHLGYPGAGWLAIGILMVLTSSQTELHDMQIMGCATEIGSAVLWVLHYNAVSIAHALAHTRGAGHVPIGKVQQTNLVVMMMWLVLAAILIVCIVFSGIGSSIFDLMGHGAVWCLRQIVRFILFLLSLLPNPGEVYQDTAGMIDQFDMGEIDAISSILMIILTAIWETLIALQRIIAMVLIVWLVIQFCKWIYHAFRAADLEERHAIAWQRTTERAVWAARERTHTLSPFDPAPSARIRRSYIRFIRKGTGYRNIRPSMTPEEILTITVIDGRTLGQGNGRGDYTLEPDNWRIERIRQLYEIARYTPAQCTLRDAAEMKRIVREVQDEMTRMERT